MLELNNHVSALKSFRLYYSYHITTQQLDGFNEQENGFRMEDFGVSGTGWPNLQDIRDVFREDATFDSRVV
jgi:hypothetical protein